MRASELAPPIQMCDALSWNAPKLPEGVELLIAHCLAGEAGGYTPGDFPDVELSPDVLDHILEEIQ